MQSYNSTSKQEILTAHDIITLFRVVLSETKQNPQHQGLYKAFTSLYYQFLNDLSNGEIKKAQAYKSVLTRQMINMQEVGDNLIKRIISEIRTDLNQENFPDHQAIKRNIKESLDELHNLKESIQHIHSDSQSQIPPIIKTGSSTKDDHALDKIQNDLNIIKKNIEESQEILNKIIDLKAQLENSSTIEQDSLRAQIDLLSKSRKIILLESLDKVNPMELGDDYEGNVLKIKINIAKTDILEHMASAELYEIEENTNATDQNVKVEKAISYLENAILSMESIVEKQRVAELQIKLGKAHSLYKYEGGDTNKDIAKRHYEDAIAFLSNYQHIVDPGSVRRNNFLRMACLSLAKLHADSANISTLKCDVSQAPIENNLIDIKQDRINVLLCARASIMQAIEIFEKNDWILSNDIEIFSQYTARLNDILFELGNQICHDFDSDQIVNDNQIEEAAFLRARDLGILDQCITLGLQIERIKIVYADLKVEFAMLNILCIEQQQQHMRNFFINQINFPETIETLSAKVNDPHFVCNNLKHQMLCKSLVASFLLYAKFLHQMKEDKDSSEQRKMGVDLFFKHLKSLEGTPFDLKVHQACLHIADYALEKKELSLALTYIAQAKQLVEKNQDQDDYARALTIVNAFDIIRIQMPKVLSLSKQEKFAEVIEVINMMESSLKSLSDKYLSESDLINQIAKVKKIIEPVKKKLAEKINQAKSTVSNTQLFPAKRKSNDDEFDVTVPKFKKP